ncbi:MAG TPA: aspartate kinase, partial [Myxococcota bacterium]|nr:aspartate kinase [Myxococcota bacterium]
MKNNFDIVVQKFGGSSVATPEKIREVALFIKERLTSVPRICVVVSAMGHTTNELLRLAHEVNSNPSKRELDMLISCGERTSMALLAMALHGQGISALSLTGSQSGIITDEEHSGAEIVAIRPERVHQAFALNQVVLIAGFQGMSRSKEITTLKRGGSDTTAVAMAAALGAKACEIYSDVCGVMDIDPRVIETAEILPEITLSEMSAMSLYGAKVMAYDAALLAEKLGIELLIAKTGDQKGGTSIR